MEKDDMSLRVDSFSCYLNSVQEKAINSSTKPPPPFSIMFSKSQDNLANLRLDSIPDTTSKFVFEIPGPIEDPTSAFTFSREIPKDGEIGVFNADRYFNMKLEYKPEANIKYETKLPLQSKPSSRFSEASSGWNSQTPLMIPDNIRRIESKKHKKAIAKKILMRLGCKGVCFDKNSITETHQKKRMIKIESSDDSRPSIEVFGSSNRMKGEVATKMERKLSMLTWDAIPKDKTVIPTPPIACDDMASEASSDLFEIENISGSTNFHLADDTSTCMSPSSVYAPSEASIQWSVVTASAAGYSVLSEFNEETSVSVAGELIMRSVEGKNGKMTKFEGAQKGRSGGILGCKNQKAADVVCQKSGIGLDATKHNQGKSGYAYPSIL